MAAWEAWTVLALHLCPLHGWANKQCLVSTGLLHPLLAAFQLSAKVHCRQIFALWSQTLPHSCLPRFSFHCLEHCAYSTHILGCSNRYQVTRSWALCALLFCVPSFPGAGKCGERRDNMGTEMSLLSNSPGVFATSASLLGIAPAMPSTAVSTRRWRQGTGARPAFCGPLCKC